MPQASISTGTPPRRSRSRPGAARRRRGRLRRSRRPAARRRSRSRRGRCRRPCGLTLLDGGDDLVLVEDLAPRALDRRRRRRRSGRRRRPCAPPKTPLTQTSILSPGSIRLTTQVSIPAEPVPLTAIVSSFLVRKTCRSVDCVSSISSRKNGSRCPMVGSGRRRRDARRDVAGAGAQEDAAGGSATGTDVHSDY